MHRTATAHVERKHSRALPSWLFHANIALLSARAHRALWGQPWHFCDVPVTPTLSPANSAWGPLPPGMIDFARRAARRNDPVLILGETGTGKDHLADLIHTLGPRARRPLRRVNVAEISDTLFERELFGHVAGAFTDARQGGKGLFEAAGGGTLVLDEIGDLPPGLQAKLLRVLEDGVVRRIGSTEEIAVDVRVIATTNSDLEAAVRAGRFRADLYYRLDVLSYHLPPLRERMQQLPELAEFLLARASRDAAPPRISPEALYLLLAYRWPGNVRQLDGVLRRAVALCDGAVIEPQHLPEALRNGTSAAPPARHAPNGGRAVRYLAPGDLLAERCLILEALRAENGERHRAARRLGMGRTTLWHKIKEHRITDDELRGV
jgi:transcriptional regulator with PAS, ATPase and Fis domain